MKRLALVAAVLAVAACGKKENAATDTTTLTPPPATTMTPVDTGVVGLDSAAVDSTAIDTAHKM